jgi:predicted nuclease of predicted toxin-antitoxin system
VRLLLDHHLSPRRVAAPLSEAGHDVLALAAEPATEGMDDDQVLELAIAEGRILVTRNARDFTPRLRARAEGRRSHAGAILIWTLGHHEFAAIVAGIERWLETYPTHEEWVDLVVAF